MFQISSGKHVVHDGYECEVDQTHGEKGHCAELWVRSSFSQPLTRQTMDKHSDVQLEITGADRPTRNNG